MSTGEQSRWQAMPGPPAYPCIDGFYVPFRNPEDFDAGRQTCLDKIGLVLAYTDKHNFQAFVRQERCKDQDKMPPIIGLALQQHDTRNMPHVDLRFYHEMNEVLNMFTKHHNRADVAQEVTCFMHNTMVVASLQSTLHLKPEALPVLKWTRTHSESAGMAYQWLNGFCERVRVSSFELKPSMMRQDTKGIWPAQEKHSMQTCGVW